MSDAASKLPSCSRPLTKKAGVPLTPLRWPLSRSRCTRAAWAEDASSVSDADGVDPE